MTERTMTEYVIDSEGKKHRINMIAKIVDWGVQYVIDVELDAYKYAFFVAKHYNQNTIVEKAVSGKFVVTVFSK